MIYTYILISFNKTKKEKEEELKNHVVNVETDK